MLAKKVKVKISLRRKTKTWMRYKKRQQTLNRWAPISLELQWNERVIKDREKKMEQGRSDAPFLGSHIYVRCQRNTLIGTMRMPF